MTEDEMVDGITDSMNIRDPLLEPGVGTGLTRSPWWKWATPRAWPFPAHPHTQVQDEGSGQSVAG